ncbi:hypothetical protein NA57DRAFT_78939 [Rhizodiscina lignyota]|uniref:Fungal-specific transcription factor domain-containing protein n=1 Tax=Rhizodiscina lignyota TaxID=1504668 RepID=A0A9P4I9Y3_9PEZI|nr:hypothetical protein NA57DRAFT_78939 [Rhizodiscina lignyota]
MPSGPPSSSRQLSSPVSQCAGLAEDATISATITSTSSNQAEPVSNPDSENTTTSERFLDDATELMTPDMQAWGEDMNPTLISLQSPQLVDVPSPPAGTHSEDDSAHELDSISTSVVNGIIAQALPTPGGQNNIGSELAIHALESGPSEAFIALPETASSYSGPLRGRDIHVIYQAPQYLSDSPERTTLLFHHQTSGILSIQDEQTNNPWRTLIWPLAQDHQALYHAIAAMTCLHMGKTQPQLHTQGIEHAQRSIQATMADIHNGNVSLDAALASSLALGFAETWDHKLSSTGFDHIKGAKFLIQQAISRHQSTPRLAEDLARLSFLAITWIYMDVIARFTSANAVTSTDLELMAACASITCHPSQLQLDPLMGCAVTLFPTIGRVADLIRRVRQRKAKASSLTITSEAVALKAIIESWVPKLQDVGEPDLNTSDSVQTAEAYRWATLLLLHQAVPELPRKYSIHDLAQKALLYLATIPPTSRTILLHLFPLMAAGCEVVDEEDRTWVRKRWQLMSRRMITGIVDRCASVTAEVWRRRDEYLSSYIAKSKESALATDSADSTGCHTFEELTGVDAANSGSSWVRLALGTPVGVENAEYAVKSELHWMQVMKSWNWEVMLG